MNKRFSVFILPVALPSLTFTSTPSIQLRSISCFLLAKKLSNDCSSSTNLSHSSITTIPKGECSVVWLARASRTEVKLTSLYPGAEVSPTLVRTNGKPALWANILAVVVFPTPEGPIKRLCPQGKQILGFSTCCINRYKPSAAEYKASSCPITSFFSSSTMDFMLLQSTFSLTAEEMSFFSIGLIILLEAALFLKEVIRDIYISLVNNFAVSLSYKPS